MTLCIAWKNHNDIRFASDSRISTDDTHFADIAIKVMQVPVKINNPIPQETGIVETIYNYKLGICYCGDTVNAHLVKETISEVLQNLQLLPTYTDFSLRGICGVIAKFFKHTSDELRNSADWDPDVEFLIGGFCPEEKKVLVFKFELVDYHDHYETIVDEVLTEDEDYLLMGSGTDRAEEIIANNGIGIGNKLLNVLRDVCKDDTEPSVGGYLQYGHFENNNFKIFGIQDYVIDEKDDLEYIYPYRGTVLYKGKFEREENDFHIGVTFIMPFEDEIEDYWKRKGIS